MIIGEKYYPTNLINIGSIRYTFFTDFYSNKDYIGDLTEIIGKHIECLSIDYSDTSFCYTLRIKKTAMRKHRGFKHDPIFYYPTIQAIFSEFVNKHKDAVLKALANVTPYPDLVLYYLNNHPELLTNLGRVSCIADNIIIINL